MNITFLLLRQIVLTVFDVFGNNSNFKIESVENLSSNKKYNTIKEEVEKGVSYDRPRYKSVYEKEN